MQSITNVTRLLLIVCFVFLSACANTATKSKPPFQLIETTIDQVHAALQLGTLQCSGLVKAYIERIQRLDQSSGLNAIIQINPNALTRARQLDQDIQAGKPLHSLYCVPVIVKDNYQTKDMSTEAGSMALKGFMSGEDAFMVKRLREADAIILARSNMGEWAFSPYDTVSGTHGETKNAYDLSRVPAGSSGGTASAVAANFGLVGMGTDTGNSIRGPSSHLALVGMRSSIGVTSRSGIVPLLVNRDIGGPMTRSVLDNAKMFNVIAGYDPADNSTEPMRERPAEDYTQGLSKNGLQQKRIGVLRSVIKPDLADPALMNLFDQALQDLRRAGASIVDNVQIANLSELIKNTGFCSRFPYDLNNYLAAFAERAPLKNFAQLLDTKNYLPRNEGAMTWAKKGIADPALQNPPCVDVQHDPRRKALLDAMTQAMDEMRLDALVYPSWSNPPRKLGDLESPHGNNSGLIAPHSGQPAITVPMGYVDEILPAGLQFLGRPFSEHLLYQLAFAYEQNTRHRKPPPLFSQALP